LRSRRHAEKKIFRDRLPRIEEEARERGWHNYYDIYKHLGVADAWRKLDLMFFAKRDFYSEFLVERLSGIGVDQELRAIPSTNQAFRLADALAALHEQAFAGGRVGDRVAEQELASTRGQVERSLLQGRAGLRATKPLRQIAAACRRMRRLVTSGSRQGAR